MTGVSTELDWIRFLWDMATRTVLVADIVQAYGDATPSAWCDTNGWWCTTDPRDEFRDALDDLDTGYGVDWAELDDDNGIHR